MYLKPLELYPTFDFKMKCILVQAKGKQNQIRTYWSCVTVGENQGNREIDWNRAPGRQSGY